MTRFYNNVKKVTVLHFTVEEQDQNYIRTGDENIHSGVSFVHGNYIVYFENPCSTHILDIQRRAIRRRKSMQR